MEGIEGAAAQSEWVAESADAFELKIVRTAADLETATGFKPEFTHQVVGPSESIVGYKSPKVTVYHSAGLLNTYISVDHAGVCQDVDAAEPDNVRKMVTDWLPQGTTHSLDAFVAGLEADAALRPSGTLMHSYRPSRAADDTVTFEVYQGNNEDPAMVEYHKRTEMWLIWYIEAASVLDLDDERWQLLHLFEKREVAGETIYSFAGLLTICAFYGFPDKVRPRISQMCILPHFQRKGHGEQLLQQAYRFCLTKYDGRLTDITVEDPSEGMVKLRDRVDCKNCWNAFPAEEFYRQGFAEAVVAIKEKLFLYAPQARRVFEIIQLRLLGSRNPEMLKPLRLAIKQRLYQPFASPISTLSSKAFRRFNDDDANSTIVVGYNPTPEEQEQVTATKDKLMKSMQDEFDQLATEYWAVIDRLQRD